MSGKRIPFILGYLAKKTDTQYARFFLSLPLSLGHGNITLTTHSHTYTLVTRSFYRMTEERKRGDFHALRASIRFSIIGQFSKPFSFIYDKKMVKGVRRERRGKGLFADNMFPRARSSTTREKHRRGSSPVLGWRLTGLVTRLNRHGYFISRPPPERRESRPHVRSPRNLVQPPRDRDPQRVLERHPRRHRRRRRRRCRHVLVVLVVSLFEPRRIKSSAAPPHFPLNC